jgi:hypothetical protein
MSEPLRIRVSGPLPARPSGVRRIVLTPQALRRLEVLRPLDGEAIAERRVGVEGRAPGHAQVCLKVGGAGHRVAPVGQDGRFTFDGVELGPGSNQLRIGPCGATCEQGTGSVALTVRVEPFLREGPDPYTRRPFAPGDDVVRCRACRGYHLAGSWQGLGRCPRCDHPDRCGPDDPAFHERPRKVKV